MKEIEDHILLEEIILGNKDSFKTLFERYYKALCNFAFVFLQSLPEAEDIVQSVFIKLWENRPGLKKIQSLQPYLYKTVRNSCYNLLKKKKVELKVLENIKKIEKENTDLNFQHQEEEFRKLYLTIEKLPEKTRFALKLCVFENYSYEEIALKMNISINTVKYHLKNAYKILRKMKILLLFIYIL